MMLKRIFYLLLIFWPGFLCAQRAVPAPYKESTPVLYRKEASGYVNIHSSGWGVGFHRSRHVTGDRKRVLEADILGMKHPKEYKINSEFDNGQSYVYGKRNGLLVIRTGYGFQNVIYNKSERGGVEIRYSYYGGISWGVTKPIYYEIILDHNRLVTEKFSPEHSSNSIYGKASFFKGFNEIGVNPGAYGKLGISFEYGSRDDDVKAIEVGTALDAYATPVPIMAMIENKRLFLTFYIQVMWGKKW
jgi:hypothetical protein